MAFTKQEFIDASFEIYKKKKQIEAIAKQRNVDEIALAVEYKVDECNIKRSNLMKESNNLQNSIQAEIKVIEDGLVA